MLLHKTFVSCNLHATADTSHVFDARPHVSMLMLPLGRQVLHLLVTLIGPSKGIDFVFKLLEVLAARMHRRLLHATFGRLADGHFPNLGIYNKLSVDYVI